VLAYATDEDTRGIDPDPLRTASTWARINPYEFALSLSRAVAQGDRKSQAGRRISKGPPGVRRLAGQHGRACAVSRFVGVYVSHVTETTRTPGFIVVDPPGSEGAWLWWKNKSSTISPSSSRRAVRIPGSTRWSHWGSQLPLRPDFPVHEVISMWQDRILAQMLSPLTLERLHDSELQLPPDQDALTTPELLNRLTTAIFSEIDKMPEAEYTNRKPAISSLRRNLQRSYLKRMSALAMGDSGAPEDCQTVAFAELSGLEGRINNVLKTNTKLDTYSRAHLEETASRIHKVLDARLNLASP
jgi:hypothetical protein